jgi:Fe-S oxidoreductase
MPDKTLVVWIVTLLGLALAALRFRRLLRPLFLAPADDRFDRVAERLSGTLEAVGLHKRLLRFRLSGLLHAFIFTSFIVLSTAILQAFGSGLFPGFSLAPIGGNTWLALLQDVFSLVLAVGIGLAIYQRVVLRPARFEGSNATDAWIIYGLVAAVVVSMLLEFAGHIAAGGDPSAPWRPVSRAIAAGLVALGVTGTAASRLAEIFYWVHIAAILTFLVYIPNSKHRHIVLAAPNIYWRSLKGKGVLPPKPESRETAGIEEIGQFSWKHMLDMLSCTECGRCQSVCPAYGSGLPLSPKMLVMDLRDHLIETGGGPSPIDLIGGVIAEETLLACTTCRACMDVCPVNIEHVPKIVDMRRQLVEEGRVQPMLQEALGNLQRTGNSMGKPAKMRAKWTRELPFKIKDARKEPVDVLWFVGDFASYDPRVQRITLKVAEVLQAAGVDFGILYEDESNSGNDVRRAGEEGLFEILAKRNLDALAGASFHRIMTTDPHSLNALRQEYGLFGADYEVVHYTALLLELVEDGRLTLKRGEGTTVTYHDPCYLGRYNGGFDAPRTLIERAGYRLHEMGRCRENSYCCGAGGGRIWADDTGVVERPSENRIREALALGDVEAFVVACPKDTVMYSAAVQALAVGDRLAVRDVIDLVDIET